MSTIQVQVPAVWIGIRDPRVGDPLIRVPLTHRTCHQEKVIVADHDPIKQVCLQIVLKCPWAILPVVDLCCPLDGSHLIGRVTLEVIIHREDFEVGHGRDHGLGDEPSSTPATWISFESVILGMLPIHPSEQGHPVCPVTMC